MFKLKHILQDDAGDVAVGGGEPATVDGAAESATPAVKSSFAAAAEVAGTDPGGDAVIVDAETDKPGEDGRPAGVPLKYWDPEKKEVRLDSLLKAQADAEKRLRGGFEAPPKEATEYTFTPDDGEDLKVEPALEKPFQEFAHKIGLNQTQYSAVLREYATGYEGAARQGVEAYVNSQVTNTVAELRKQHGSDSAVKAIQVSAFEAFKAFASPEEMAQVNELPDHPALINVLARINAQLKEGRPPNLQQQGDPFDQLTIEADSFYRDVNGPFYDVNHKDHPAAKAKVDRWERMCADKGLQSLKVRQKLAPR